MTDILATYDVQTRKYKIVKHEVLLGFVKNEHDYHLFEIAMQNGISYMHLENLVRDARQKGPY